MSSRFLLAGSLLLIACMGASSALAHGGIYRGPGGMIPPEAREPGDPTPPPPPPATGPATPPSTTPGSAPRLGTPVTPPPAPVTPGTPALGGERGGGPRTGLGMDSWLFWYEMNKEVLQDLKHSIYATVDTDNPLHTMGAGGHTNRSGANVQRSAAVALGVLGQRGSGEERAGIAAALLDALKRRRVRDGSAVAFTVMSLARLVTADVDTQSTDVLARTEAGERLLALADEGRPDVRAYGALALGLISRGIGDSTTIEVYGTFRARARDALRAGLASRSLDARTRAAFAVALGLARDEGSVPDLVALVEDDKEDAALGLGHLGIDTPAVLRPIRQALKGRSSEQLRRSTAAALGMLRDREAVRLLLEELRIARSQSVKGEVVVALAKVGDERAIDPLVALVRDEQEQDLTRALACAGLGIVGDLEWIPSLSRLSSDLNYRAVGSLMSEVLSIL